MARSFGPCSYIDEDVELPEMCIVKKICQVKWWNRLPVTTRRRGVGKLMACTAVLIKTSLIM